MAQLVTNIDISSSTFVVEQAASCSLFFVRPSSFCEALRNCIEPGVLCWNKNDSSCDNNSTPLDFQTCDFNETTILHCSCSYSVDVSKNLVTRLSDDIMASSNNPSEFNPIPDGDNSTTTSLTTNSMPSTSHATSTSAPQSSGGLSGGEIAAIVICSLLFVAAVIGLTIWIVIKLKRKRRLEGKYFPSMEEQKSNVKNLPQLPPPNIEGLI